MGDYIERKAHVRFPAKAVGELARALNSSPGLPFVNSIVQIVIDNQETIDLQITGYLAHELSQVHSKIWGEEDVFILLYTDGKYILELDTEDVKALFYTLEKVIAGADPVDLDGEMDVREYMSTEVFQDIEPIAPILQDLSLQLVVTRANGDVETINVPKDQIKVGPTLN